MKMIRRQNKVLAIASECVYAFIHTGTGTYRYATFLEDLILVLIVLQFSSFSFNLYNFL